jgi:hypothetical protein
MSLNHDVVYRCRRLGSFHQLHPSRSAAWSVTTIAFMKLSPRSFVSLVEMLQRSKSRTNSALPVVDVTSLLELLGARQRLDQ